MVYHAHILAPYLPINVLITRVNVIVSLLISNPTKYAKSEIYKKFLNKEKLC